MNPNRRKAAIRLFSALALALGAWAAPASASQFSLLHVYCNESTCHEGKTPSGSLLMDDSRNLYGTTEAGGANGGGVVYELAFNSDTGGYHYKVLYNFCLLVNCGDGTTPVNSRLIMDTDGDIYGTFSAGGATPNGGIFKLTPNDSHTRYTETVIYSFCQAFSACEDGAFPTGGLTYDGAASGAPYDGTSALYGLTRNGGRRHKGVVFSLTPQGTNWTQKVLYFFCHTHTHDQACTDGSVPAGDLALDKNGNLIGTASQDGPNAAGLIFKLVPTTKGHWAESVLYPFCSDANCADGKTPQTGVIMDATGNVFGTTTFGGMNAERCDPAGCGVVFKLTPNGNETTDYSFCNQTDCIDGANPAGLWMDTFGNIFGVANSGGTDKNGTIYELNASFVVLYNNKCSKRRGCPQGVTSTGSLVENPGGDLFGTFVDDGRNGSGGTIFKFTP